MSEEDFTEKNKKFQISTSTRWEIPCTEGHQNGKRDFWTHEEKIQNNIASFFINRNAHQKVQSFPLEKDQKDSFANEKQRAMEVNFDSRVPSV